MQQTQSQCFIVILSPLLGLVADCDGRLEGGRRPARQGAGRGRDLLGARHNGLPICQVQNSRLCVPPHTALDLHGRHCSRTKCKLVRRSPARSASTPRMLPQVEGRQARGDGPGVVSQPAGRGATGCEARRVHLLRRRGAPGQLSVRHPQPVRCDVQGAAGTTIICHSSSASQKAAAHLKQQQRIAYLLASASGSLPSLLKT